MGCDIHAYAETRKNGQWTADAADDFTDKGYASMPDLDLDRNYWLFGLLAKGVRTEWPWSFEQKGVPDDMSEEMRAIVGPESYDDHSHSWLTLDELRSKRMELMLQSESDAHALHGYLSDLIDSNWPKDAKGDEHRIVFFFDN